MSPPRPRLPASSLRRWRTVHTVSSLICTVFLLVLCLTGLPLIFHDELEDALGGAHSLAAPASAPLLPLDKLLAEAKQRYPGEAVNFISLPDDDPGLATVGLIDAHGAYHWVKYDRHRGDLLDDQRRQGVQRIGFLDVMLAIHSSLTVGLPGTLLLGVMGLLFLVALVSGVFLYRPFAPRGGLDAMRLRGAPRLRWLDLHNIVGMVLLAWLAMAGITGVFNTLEKPLFGLWQATDVAAMVAAQRAAPDSATPVSVQAMVDQARRLHPGQSVASILFPSAARHHPNHYLIWLHGDQPLTRELLSPVLVDAHSGRLIDGARLPGYLVALEVSRPLHFGDYGGLPLKWLWLVFDLAAIMVLLSGIYLWVKRHRGNHRSAHRSAA